MSNEPSVEQRVQAVYEYAASMVKAGKSREEIHADLASKGLSQESVTIVVNNIFDLRSKALQKAGKKNMLYGALWCIGGILVTAFTYQAAASSPTGGHYIVAWGAIIFGAIQFFRGLMQSGGGDKPLDQQKTPEQQTKDATECVSCHKEIPAGQTRCPVCGWSYLSQQW
jgi:hypothetical protein